MEFQLAEKLQMDTVLVTDLPLSRLLLMDDCQFPWVILVPRRPHLREIHDLTDCDQEILMGEITRVSRTVQEMTGALKINIGALGNMVPQLHIHVIARFAEDPAWPAPVWGRLPPKPYTTPAKAAFCADLRQRLST